MACQKIGEPAGNVTAGRGRISRAIPVMMKEPANVTMMAGRRMNATMEPVSAPMTKPLRITAATPPKTPKALPIVVAAMTAPRLTSGPMASVMPPFSINSACAIVTSASGNQFCVNLEKPLTLRIPGNNQA